MMSVFSIYAVNGEARVDDQMGLPVDLDTVRRIIDICQNYLAANTDAAISDIYRTSIAINHPGMYEHIFGEVLPKQYRPDPETPSRRPSPRAGYVYLMHGTGTNWYKIGVSINVSSRRTSIGLKAPFHVVLVAERHTNDMYADESLWHSDFADKRVNGEWFVLGESEIHRFRLWAEGTQ